MTIRRWSVVAPAALLVAVSCRAPAPAIAPAPTAAESQAAADSAAAASLRRDSLAAAARRDSLAAAQADSLRLAAQAEARAESVQLEVGRATTDTATGAVATGLSAAETALLGDRIHFAFDRSAISAEDQAKLDRKAQLLAAHPGLRIRIAGNCDARGSEEYNLALGERRAAAALRYLVAHGVAASRIDILSYGKERPIDRGHDQAAWAANRRDDFAAARGGR
jgi:peptidoglycan-associated lipoprotein